MHATLLLTALASLALALALPGTKRSDSDPSKHGRALILNRCDFPVYFWPVSQSRNPTEPIVIKPTGDYSESFQLAKADGESLKFSRTPQLKDITQFEYTLVPDQDASGQKSDGTIWYSGSNVDCVTGSCPFEKEGVALIPSDEKCPTKRCGKGEAPCKAFHTKAGDHAAIAACGSKAVITMMLCSG